MGVIVLPERTVCAADSLLGWFGRYEDILDHYAVADPSDVKEVLVLCLPKLADLEKVVVASAIDRPGLNGDDFFFDHDYEQRLPDLQNVDDKEHLAATLAHESMVELLRVDIFVDALAETGVALRSVEIGNGLFDQVHHYTNDLDYPIHNPHF